MPAFLVVPTFISVRSVFQTKPSGAWRALYRTAVRRAQERTFVLTLRIKLRTHRQAVRSLARGAVYRFLVVLGCGGTLVISLAWPGDGTDCAELSMCAYLWLAVDGRGDYVLAQPGGGTPGGTRRACLSVFLYL